MSLKGTNHLHKSFILHRDLKPNNLLIGADGILKLADFGLARDFGDPFRLMTTQVVTRWYRSPELLLGAKQYGGNIDIWALGCIFAELLLRTPYLPGDSEIDQLTVTYKALGTPTIEEWPESRSLPYWTDFKKTFPKQDLKNLFTAATTDCIDLLTKMFIYNPNQRITSEQVNSFLI